jgi:hypothetical protein
MVRSRQKGRKLTRFPNVTKIAQKWVDEKCVVCRDGLELVLE